MESLKKWTFTVFLILLQNRKIDTVILKNNNIFTLHFSLFFFKKHTLMYLRCKQNCIWFCCRHLKSFLEFEFCPFSCILESLCVEVNFSYFKIRYLVSFLLKIKKLTNYIYEYFNKDHRMQYNQHVRSTFSYGIREWCKIRTNLNIFIPICTFNLINTFQ